jgi:hypothetical protein
MRVIGILEPKLHAEAGGGAVNDAPAMDPEALGER